MTDGSVFFSLFAASFLSATILPFSSEGALALMIYQGYHPVLCLLVATAGNSLGGLTNYILGRLGNLVVLEKYLGIKKNKIEKLKKYADKYGAYSALLGWTPLLGDPLIAALGFFRVNFYQVLIWMVLGKFLRYLFIILIMEPLGG